MRTIAFSILTSFVVLGGACVFFAARATAADPSAKEKPKAAAAESDDDNLFGDDDAPAAAADDALPDDAAADDAATDDAAPDDAMPDVSATEAADDQGIFADDPEVGDEPLEVAADQPDDEPALNESSESMDDEPAEAATDDELAADDSEPAADDSSAESDDNLFDDDAPKTEPAADDDSANSDSGDAMPDNDADADDSDAMPDKDNDADAHDADADDSDAMPDSDADADQGDAMPDKDDVDADASADNTIDKDATDSDASDSDSNAGDDDASVTIIDKPIELKVSTTPDPPGMKRLDKHYDVWIDPEHKRVVMDGRVCLRDGQLEMFACLKGTKEHESIVAVETRAFIVHAALLAIGANPGTPVAFRPKYTPATGPTIDISLVWSDADKGVHRESAQNWIKDIKTGKAMQYPWVFAGSGFWVNGKTGDKQYLAESGDFICVSNFPSAMMDLPVESSQSNDELQFRAFTEHIPPAGTKVRIVLTPRRK